jgi:hypothetical protein
VTLVEFVYPVLVTLVVLIYLVYVILFEFVYPI